MIEMIKNCCLARSKKVNEVIKRLNPLLDIKVAVDPFADEPSVTYTDNNVTLTLTEGGGAGDFDEEVFKVVVSGNQVEERIFLTKSAP